MDIVLHASAQETSGGNSDYFNRADMVLVGLFVNVTDIQGVLPSLTVTLQQSPNGNDWYNVGSIAVTRSTTGASVSSPAALAMLADYIRVTWTLSGTGNPSATFSAEVVTHPT